MQERPMIQVGHNKAPQSSEAVSPTQRMLEALITDWQNFENGRNRSAEGLFDRGTNDDISAAKRKLAEDYALRIAKH
jgi:hypothetical protein